MMKKFTILTLFCWLCWVSFANSQQIDDAETQKANTLQKPLGRADDAYGKLNKGELINTVGNYGLISDAYLQNVIYNFAWPKNKGAETSDIGSEDATDDFAFLFATAGVKNFLGTGTVIDGHTNYDKEDWRGVDGAAGHYHCAIDQQRDYLLAPDGTPMMATSDLPETWPAGWMDDYDIWPGTWHPAPTGPYADLSGPDKALVDSLAGWYDSIYDLWRFWPGKFRINSKTGQQVKGEFAGDRHVWCIMDDKNNLQGPRVGIVVEMEGICYGRPYAEDFHFYDFTIRNTSSSHLDSCWWGYYIDPKFGDVREEEFYTYNCGINPNDSYNVFIQYDPDGQTVPGRWREIGVFGMAVLRTPHDVGVTDAHFNPDGGANPTSDWELWAQITGNPADPFVPQPVANYFHGPDSHLDDFSLSWGKPQDYGYLVMSGPFSMEPGEKVKATIVVSAGADQVELMGDKSALESGDFATNIQVARDMFLVNFQGPAGPPSPALYGIAGDGKVTLYWDDIPEKKEDPFSGELDFEGYKIYRSVDGGATWGKPITNALGQVVGYVPMVQFDYDNLVSGIDPVDVNNYLGSNTGLKHVFVDSTVKNGILYTYTITAYDRGDPAINLSSFESARGTNFIEKNVVAVTPRSSPIGYIDPLVTIESHAQGNGTVSAAVIDPSETQEIYRIGFSESPATTFDVLANDVLLATFPINSEADPPLVNGIRFGLEGDTQVGGIKTVTDEYGRNILGSENSDTTANWFVKLVELVPNTQAPFEAQAADYEIRFTSDSSLASKAGRDPQLADMKIPFAVWNVSVEPAVQVNCLIAGMDFKYDLGDVVYIASNPYTATAAGDTISVSWKEDCPYKIVIKATASNAENKLPLEGQRIKMTAYRAFSVNDYFRVIIDPPEIQATTSEMASRLNDVRVVPNPYVVNAQWEVQQNERRIRFMFLPDKCDISIYTVVGERITKIQHDDGTGDQDWNLLSEVGQEIAFGMYIYVIEAFDSVGNKHEKIGKFMVIK